MRLSLTVVTNSIKNFFASAFEAPSSLYPLGPLDPEEQAPNTTPYFADPPDLDEAARQIDQGQTTATFISTIAPEPSVLLDAYLRAVSVGLSPSHLWPRIYPQAQIDEHLPHVLGPPIRSKRRTSFCLSTVTGYSASSQARSSVRSFMMNPPLNDIPLSWCPGPSTHSSNKSHKCASLVSSEMPAPMLGLNDEELRNSRRSDTRGRAVDAAGAATTVQQPYLLLRHSGNWCC